MKHHEYNDDDELDLPPSKTKVKKQMHDLQDLGEQLTQLSKEQLAELKLPENLHNAIAEVKRIKSFGAIKRQIQYVGKLMREIDPEPVREQLAVWAGTSRQHVAWLHQLERLRDQLLENPDTLTELLQDHPGVDVQHLRSLIRNAIKEKEQGKPPKNYREIFQALREMIPEHRAAQSAAQSDETND